MKNIDIQKHIAAIKAFVRNTGSNTRLFFVGCVLVLAGIFFVGHSSSPKKVSAKRFKPPAVHKTVSLPSDLKEGTIKRGESLYQIIARHGGDPGQAGAISKVMRAYYNPRRLKISDRYRIRVSTAGQVLLFEYLPNLTDRISIVRKNGRFSASLEKVELARTVTAVSGNIRSSLWESMQKKGVRADIIVGFAEMFEWNIDFLTETRNGDRFWVYWEDQQTPDGRTIPGRVLGGSYKGKIAGKHMGIYFKPEGQRGGYYDTDGRSLRKAFLRAPLNYRRISSHFSNRRYHPILRYYRPHHGTDYAAPRGTPVSSIGDGTVTFKGWKGPNGKMVSIRHNSVYSSDYGHLSSFARGITVGKRVRQGQDIGFVGSTGLSTGPHLHFGLNKYGKPINFLRVKMPPSKKLDAAYLPAFKKQKRDVFLSWAEHRFNLNQANTMARGD